MKLTTAVVLAALMLCPALPVGAHSPRPRTRNVQYGVASWYGRHWRGRRTASGAFFDDRALTAAHRTLPLGTRVQVTNLKNGRSVVVRVTDRGPRVRRRLIDLSRAAAERIGFTHRGVTRVKVEVMGNRRAGEGGSKPVPESSPQ